MMPEIEIALVNPPNLDVRREVVGVAEHEPRELFIFLKIAGDDDQPRAELAGSRHRLRHVGAELPRFIARGGNDAAPFAADRHRLAPQFWVGGLLDGREERIGVEVDDHRRRGVKRSANSNYVTNGPRGRLASPPADARPHQSNFRRLALISHSRDLARRQRAA